MIDELGPKLKKRKRVQHRAPNAVTVVTDEDLQWKEVAIPDRLEDAEGFLGLGIEEIEDVEVVKDQDSRGAKFRVWLFSLMVRHEEF